MSMKNSIIIGDRTRGLPACRAVPQPNAVNDLKTLKLPTNAQL
jgi:hypothetical protein